MSQTTFAQQVLNDIHEFLNQNTKVFANERDLQMNLAVYLRMIQNEISITVYIQKHHFNRKGKTRN